MTRLAFVGLHAPILWLGFVLAISFLEAPIKFRAPHADRRAALSIGQLVFRALVRVEIALALVTAASLAVAGFPAAPTGWFAAVAATLTVQVVWLLPRLDALATERIAGRSGGPSRAHVAYVAGECAKVVLLGGLIWTTLTALGGRLP